MSEETNKDIAVLSLLTDLNKLLDGDANLMARVKDKLNLLPVNANVSKVMLTKRAKQSYYSERFALELKPTLDALIEKHEPVQFLVSEHPNLTVRTLYLKLYQPWQWLMDFHPDKAKYRQLKQETIIQQKANHSVRILFESQLTTLTPKPIDANVDNFVKLQNKITEFLMMPIDKDQMFDERKCSLNDDQMALIRESLVGLPNIANIIEPSRVRIMRKFVDLK